MTSKLDSSKYENIQSTVGDLNSLNTLSGVLNPIKIFMTLGNNSLSRLFSTPDVQRDVNHHTFSPLKNLYINGTLNWYDVNFSFQKYVTDKSVEGFNLLQNQYKDVMSRQIEVNMKYQNLETLLEVVKHIELQDALEIFEVCSVNVDNSMYAYLSLPPVKLYYPEPYVASPSLQHEELWFIHVLHYQHILWFCFISLIMFYFITFINVVRYCNPRVKPKRETRGVSRSKCADLITACVPVSWALSIIISESVDATDYYDGFGTGEVVVGIRAYQWGWEYYFPKNMDLNYTAEPSYSSVTGNSLKYSKYSNNSSSSVFLWKNMSTKSGLVKGSSPTHAILSPSDNSKILNFIDVNSLGTNTLNALTAFRNTQLVSKFNSSDLFESSTDYNTTYTKLSDNYINNLLTQNNYSYGTTRQHNYSSLSATLNNVNNTLDSSTVDQILNYNSNLSKMNYYNTRTNESKGVVLRPSNYVNNVNLEYANNTNLRSYTKKGVVGTMLIRGDNSQLKLLNLNYSKLLSHRVNYLNLKPSHFDWSRFYGKSPNWILEMKDKNTRLSLGVNPSNSVSGLEVNPKALDKTSLGSVGVISRSLDTTFTYPHPPTTLFGSKNANIDYDRLREVNDVPNLIEEKTPKSANFPFETWWETVWARPKFSDKEYLSSNFTKVKQGLTLPNITEYLDYDFKNWQQLNQLEDLYWESTFLDSENSNYESLPFKIQKFKWYLENERLFNDQHRSKLPKFKRFNYVSPITIYSPELHPNSKFLTTNSFSTFDNEVELDDNIGLYKNNKVINYLFYRTYLNTLNSYTYSNIPMLHTQVMNMFISNFDENLNTLDSDSTDHTGDSVDISSANDVRSYNNLKLRQTCKAALKVITVVHQVFNPRFAENKWNTNTIDLSKGTYHRPFISGNQVNYNNLVMKNNSNYFNSVFYKNKILSDSNLYNSIFSSTNTYFTNLPFLVSMRSDPIKYAWVDHQSRWSSLEVQPSSVARYSLVGLPYTINKFEFNAKSQELMSTSEGYNLRLARARKNYISNWSTSPFLYTRLSNWYGRYGVVNSLLGDTSVSTLRLNLKASRLYWSRSNFNLFKNKPTPSYTDVSTPGRSSWKPMSGVGSYMYNLTVLNQILSKREYLYSEYFLNKSNNLKLPDYLKSTPTNSLLVEIKNTYKFTNPSNFINELSRDFYYNNTILNNIVLSNHWSSLSESLNISRFINNMFYYLIETSNYLTKSKANLEVYKNQYRPMRKGISNMVRLHATGAIALPIEVRLHIMASSRDIIHSWAIPSAGIKIDCIPGYSSHRVAIFLVSGIFWGQCMEICGRFHHWMPIIVYFVKRDLFFLWCMTFVHMNTLDRNFQLGTNELLLKPRRVSL